MCSALIQHLIGQASHSMASWGMVSSTAMACASHTRWQTPQWVHQGSLITAFFFTSFTAFTGQSRTQYPQPIHFSVSTFIAEIQKLQEILL
jgi:hypothetical protein